MATDAIDRLNGFTASSAVKIPATIATTANIALSGLQTIDSRVLVTDDRVLVKDQDTASENGVYNAATSTWKRVADFDGARDIVQGTIVYVPNGTTQSPTFYAVTSANPITIGTDDINFSSAVFAITGTAASFTVVGSTTPVNGIYLPTANKVGIAANSALQAQIEPGGDGTNYLTINGADTVTSPVISVGGETNVGLALHTKGIGAFDVFTNAGAQQQLKVAHTTDAVNYLSITGGVTGAPGVIPITAAGSDTNIDITVTPKGTGKLNTTGVNVTGTNAPNLGIYTSSSNVLGLTANGIEQVQVTGTALVVNKLKITGAETTDDVTVEAVGSDANINLALVAKGTGVVAFTGSSVVANGSIAVSITSVGPTGASTTIQEWLAVELDNTIRYIPTY